MTTYIHIPCCLDDDDVTYFESCARIRGITRTTLLRHVLRTVARDQLVLGILDDVMDTATPEDETAAQAARRVSRRESVYVQHESSLK